MTRRATSMTLDRTLLDEARALGVNISRAAEAGIEAEVRTAKAEAWRRENAAAIAETNAWVEKTGLPLARYRTF
jgi:antitoxin CcdA